MKTTYLIFSILLLLCTSKCSLIDVSNHRLLATTPAIIPNASLLTNPILDQILGLIDQNIINLDGIRNVSVRKLVRAPFHDCNGGACDASINNLNTHNRGLSPLVTNLTEEYLRSANSSFYQTYLSRSDFFVLCYLRGLAQGIINGGSTTPNPLGTPKYIFGRLDKINDGPKNDTYEGIFPDGTANWTMNDANHPTTIMESLGNEAPVGQTSLGLGLSEVDIVALFGLHGAGRADNVYSGFSGTWGTAASLDIISNAFYINLLAKGQPKAKFNQLLVIPTTPENNTLASPPPSPAVKIQWGKTTASKLMMNADMQIYLNTTLDSDGNASTQSKPSVYCNQGNNVTLYNCSQSGATYMPLSRNAQLAWDFASNNTLYLNSLVAAYIRLNNYTDTDPTKLVSLSPTIACDTTSHQQYCSGDVLKSNPCGTLSTC